MTSSLSSWYLTSWPHSFENGLGISIEKSISVFYYYIETKGLWLFFKCARGRVNCKEYENPIQGHKVTKRPKKYLRVCPKCRVIDNCVAQKLQQFSIVGLPLLKQRLINHCSLCKRTCTEYKDAIKSPKVTKNLKSSSGVVQSDVLSDLLPSKNQNFSIVGLQHLK